MAELWVTNPALNTNGQTITDEGAALMQEGDDVWLNVWFGWESGSISIPAEDLPALRDALNSLVGKKTPDCGGPDCKMIELHTIGSCPTHPEEPPTLVGWNESEAWYDNPEEEEEGGCPFCKPHPDHYAECPIVNDDGDQCRCNNPQ